MARALFFVDPPRCGTELTRDSLSAKLPAPFCIKSARTPRATLISETSLALPTGFRDGKRMTSTTRCGNSFVIPWQKWLRGSLFAVLFAIFAVSPFSSALLTARADPERGTWNLPAELSDRNVSIKFAIDSTWRVVQGQFAEVSGSAKLARTNDPTSLSAQLTIPVRTLTAGTSGRAERLRAALSADQFANIIVDISSMYPISNDVRDLEQPSTKIVLRGTVTIRDKTKDLELAGTMFRHGGRVIIEGDTNIEWRQFGIQAPSQFLSRYDEIVHVHFSAVLRPAAKPFSPNG